MQLHLLMTSFALVASDVSHLHEQEGYNSKPYAFTYTAGRYPGHADRQHTEVSDGSGVIRVLATGPRSQQNTKTVAPGAVVEKGAYVYPGAMVMSGAVIKQGAIVYDGALVKGGAVVGPNSRVWNNATVGGGVVLGNGVIMYHGAQVRDGAKLATEPIQATVVPSVSCCGPVLLPWAIEMLYC